MSKQNETSEKSTGSKLCPKCFGYGHSGKPAMITCVKCGGLGYVQFTKRQKMTFKESAEQGSFSGYIKKHHPGLRFKTNKPEGKKTRRAQNEIRKKNSNSGFPDMDIERPVAPFAGLKIENKKSGVTLTRGQFIKDEFAHQYVCHKQLINEGYAVYFACSVQEAIDILEAYLSGNALPFQVFELSPKLAFEYEGCY